VNLDEKKQVAEQLTVTLEMCGHQWSQATFKGAMIHLDACQATAVIGALHRCQRELKCRLSLADIIERIEEAAADGWPGPNEAWAAVGTTDEFRTIVCVQEALTARAEVSKPGADGERSLLKRDPVAARVSFIESYRRLIAQAKAEGRRPRWEVSEGFDKADRARAVRDAVVRGQLVGDDLVRALDKVGPIEGLALPGAPPQRLLPGQIRQAQKDREAFEKARDGGPEALAALREQLEQRERDERAATARESAARLAAGGPGAAEQQAEAMREFADREARRMA
jgi:hypothetical protein